jgi:hypothetical protein
MWNGGERSGTVRDGEGLWCHDDGLWVTLAENGNGTVTVTGQNHNFYCIKKGEKKNMHKKRAKVSKSK